MVGAEGLPPEADRLLVPHQKILHSLPQGRRRRMVGAEGLEPPTPSV